MNEHIGETVWRSSMKGGEANPEQRRDLIGKPPMFNYPTGTSAPASPHGVAVEE